MKKIFLFSFLLLFFFPNPIFSLFCGINPPINESYCFIIDDNSELEEDCCLINNTNNKYCYLLSKSEIAQKKIFFNNENYDIFCRNKTYEKNRNVPLLGMKCIDEEIKDITDPKNCTEFNKFDGRKYPCCLFRMQNVAEDGEIEINNICISLGEIGTQDYLTYDKNILDCFGNMVINKISIVFVYLMIYAFF